MRIGSTLEIYNLGWRCRVEPRKLLAVYPGGVQGNENRQEEIGMKS
jgi:hypothetical protein